MSPTNCARCGHSCPTDRPCARCAGDPMGPGDSLCVVCDGSPSVPDTVADTARSLARHWDESPTVAGLDIEWLAARRRVILQAAAAAGPQVDACFRALVTGDAGREVGR